MSTQSIAAGIGLLLQLIEQAARVSSVIRQAQAEGREVTREELETIVAENDAARQGLVDAINRAS
jgi:RNA:NAD 2'-phosphotransferase (TPT1/KptA family)